MSHSFSVRPIIRSTLFAVATAVAVGACMDAPNAPPAAIVARGTPVLAKGTAGGPYIAVFDDTVTNKLRSDGRGSYPGTGADDCTGSDVHASGLYQLRTIRNTSECKALIRGEWRFFTIDFGTATPLDFDQDGIPEAIEAAPGRLLADNAFATRAASTPVKIYILKVMTDSTSQNQAYWIQYRNNVSVSNVSTESGTTVRVLQARPGSATVDIFDAAGGFLATRDLPFKLSLTKVP